MSSSIPNPSALAAGIALQDAGMLALHEGEEVVVLEEDQRLSLPDLHYPEENLEFEGMSARAWRQRQKTQRRKKKAFRP